MTEFEFQESRVMLQKVRYTVAAKNEHEALRLIATHQVTPVPVGPAVLIHAGELEPLKPTVVATYDSAGCPIWHNLEQSAAVL